MSLLRRLTPDLREGSNDLRIYRESAEAILRGEFPYRDFFIEYPPGSLPFFLPPALLGDGRDSYITLFASEMALCLVAATFLVALAARRMHGAWAWPVPAITVAAGAALLYPVATTRYDSAVALTLALAAAFGTRRPILAHAALGLGAAAKLVPALAALPLALTRGRAALPGLAVFSGVLALFFVPSLLLGGEGFIRSFAYHAERGLQVESVASSVLMQFGLVSGITFEYGAFQAQGPGTELAASLSLPVTAVLLLVTAAVAYRAHRRSEPGEEIFPRYAAALILTFMLGSKVLSPQYLLWLLPLVPPAAAPWRGAGLCALLLAACWTTTQVFPYHYGDLLRGHSPGPELLLLRNLLLVLLWALLLLLPVKKDSG
jgi:hypothetical protein